MWAVVSLVSPCLLVACTCTKSVPCCNPSLGFATKTRVCKGVGQEGSSGVTSHARKSEREFEGMNPRIPK
jgi:hypothetical protein